MEKQIFDWREFLDSGDDFDVFGGVTLKVGVGPWKAGHTFPSEVAVSILRDSGRLVIYWPDETEEMYELHLTVGERVGEKTP